MGQHKLLQKKFYDLLSHRYGLLVIIIGIFLIVVSALQFGETFLEWSSDKYEAMFNSFSDNVGGRSYQGHLCGTIPMDVVYTWVNGSDPRMLRDLDAYRDMLSLKYSSEEESFHDWCHRCLAWPLLVFKPAINPNSSLSVFTSSKDIQFLEGNFTLVTYATLNDSINAFNETKQLIESGQLNITAVYLGYLTSDQSLSNTVLDRVIALRGFPDSFSIEDIRKNVPENYKIQSVSLHSSEGLAIVEVEDKASYNGLLKSNFTIEGKKPSFSAMRVVWKSSRSDDVSDSRYQDNEELRYSLRSIDRFAPWVRQVFLVTNGQIPSWLNLDNSRIKIVTHEEIFPNKSHLPTFSSPAIESHLHRIPGLSDKFIYMNDDVMFGKPVWPDDFHTPSHGQKVYLSWPVPNCNEGCPNSWIKDGYCDKPCNNSECDWDAGDCDPSKAKSSQSGLFPAAAVHPEQLYCHTGCSNSWLADRYCDQACNVHSCAFDAGDCGVNNYHHFHELALKKKNGTVYELRQGELIIYFNFSSVFRKVTGANYDQSPVIRTAAVGNKFHVLTLLLFEKHNSTVLNFTLTGTGRDNRTLTIKFHVRANTHPVQETALIKSKLLTFGNQNNTKLKVVSTMAPFVFKEVPEELQRPRILATKEIFERKLFHEQIIATRMSLTSLPAAVAGNLTKLLQQLNNGDLSDKGFQREAFNLMSDFALQSKTDLGSLLESLKVKEVPKIAVSNSSFVSNSSRVHTRKLQSFFDSLQPVNYKAEMPVESVYLGRKLLDTFGDSLRHVNRLYNKEFGFTSRKVPGHMPHMVDKHIFAAMQKRFSDYWDETSSHKIRSGNDMQFAFSYFYFLMSEPRNITHGEFFDEMDVDKSGVLSDREIRTMVTRMFNLPIDLDTLMSIESKFKNCSVIQQSESVPEDSREFYYDKLMPQVTKSLFVNCSEITKLVDSSQKGRKKYKYEEMGEDEIAFKMVRTNMSSVVGQLDDIRKSPRKFICLNDNIDHRSDQAQVVKNVLHDFYESFFPTPSQFELLPEYRNRYLYVDELRQWQAYRGMLKLGLNVMLCLLVLFSLASYFERHLEGLRRKVFGRRRPRQTAMTV